MFVNVHDDKSILFTIFGGADWSLKQILLKSLHERDSMLPLPSCSWEQKRAKINLKICAYVW